MALAFPATLLALLAASAMGALVTSPALNDTLTPGLTYRIAWIASAIACKHDDSSRFRVTVTEPSRQ